jgi:hypothetical protein
MKGRIGMIPVGRLCSCFGCKKLATKKGMCEMHYMRAWRHGHTEQTRALDWGEREKHPLYRYWCQLRRSNGASLGQWYDDFWKFVREVGERPASNPLLIRLDTSGPWAVGNVMWCESKAGPARDETHREQRESRAEYMRDWQVKRRAGDRLHDFANSLKRFHGISLDDYERLLDAQGGKCAICGRGEGRKDERTGTAYRYAVDHCHATNELRGLLCSMCNHAIGYLDDSPELLRRAIAYLMDPPARRLGLTRTGPTKKRIREREASPYAVPSPLDTPHPHILSGEPPWPPGFVN